MLSRSTKISLADTKRSSSMGTTKYLSIDENSIALSHSVNKNDNDNNSSSNINTNSATTTNNFSFNIAASASNKYKKLSSMISSLPFRYVDSTPQSLSMSAECANYSSSSLSGSFYTNESVSSNRNNQRVDSMQRLASLSSSDMDMDMDERHDAFEEESLLELSNGNGNSDKYMSNNAEISHAIEAERSETDFASQFANSTTLPSFGGGGGREAGGLRKYGIRRHHSAPQSDAKWLQVRCTRIQLIIAIHKHINLYIR